MLVLLIRHKAELEKLKEKDPEFFKFLEKTESRLLDFGKDEDEEDDEEAEDDEEDTEDGKRSKKREAGELFEGKSTHGASL